MPDETNLKTLMDKIRAARARIDTAKLHRKAQNDIIAEERSAMEAAGIHKAALDMAMRYAGWDEDKREGFDTAYALVREALSLPLEDDLFSFEGEAEQPAQPAGIDPGVAAAAESQPAGKRTKTAKGPMAPAGRPSSEALSNAAAEAAQRQTDIAAAARQNEEKEQREGAAALEGVGLDGRPSN